MDTRWWILIYCSIHSFATDFWYDEPSILVQRLVGTAPACAPNGTDFCMNLDLYQFNLIFSVNSWSGALAAICAGVIVDRFGTKIALWVSSAFIFVAPLMFALSAYTSNMRAAFALILTARILMGFGTGSGVVLTHRMKASWFLYRELALAFSIHIVMGRLGTATCFLLIGGLIEQLGLRGSLWLGFGLACCASLSGLVMAHLDQRHSAYTQVSPADDFKGAWRFLRHSQCIFWCFVVLGFFFYGSVGIFTANAPNFLAMRYGFSESKSSYVTGILYDIGLLAPLSGFLTDRYGHRQHWLAGSAILVFIGVLLLFVIPPSPPGLWIIFMGIGYTAFAPTIWSSVPLIVPAEHVGMATGTGKFFQFIGVGALTLCSGVILDMNQSRRIVPWNAFFVFLLCCLGVCIIASLLVVWLNRPEQHLTPSQRARDAQNIIREITPLNVDYGTGSIGSKSFGAIAGSSSPARLTDEAAEPLMGETYRERVKSVSDRSDRSRGSGRS